MRTRARWAGGTVHTLLGVLALGLLAISILLDVVGLWLRRPAWAEAARADLEVGLLAGVAAVGLSLIAVGGSSPGSKDRRLAVLRASTEASAFILFAGALGVRLMSGGGSPSNAALALSAGGLGIGAAAAWLGREIAARPPG